uniref:Ig-like domain-containing protein n=1 Tax=Poecilia latipinna TaxID=48699 RepID=A0A3B3V5T3_9TELE
LYRLIFTQFPAFTFKVIYLRVGDDVKLDSSYLPINYYVRWFFEKEDGLELADTSYLGRKQVNPDSGEIWTRRLTISPNSLTINDMQEENFGTIICIVKDGSTRYDTFKFHLIKVTVSIKEQLPVIPGHSLSLNCDAETRRQHSIYWLKPTGRKATSVRGSVTKTAESQDNGEWECVVKDNGKESRFKFPVSVVDFSSASKYVYTSTNLPLSLPFRITPKEFVQKIPSEVETVEWLVTPKTSSSQQTIFSFSPKNGQLKQEDPARELSYKNFTADGSFSLYKNLAKVEDRGTYNCSITFKNGYMVSRTLVVEVVEITPSPGTELISGHHLNLSCSTGGPLETGVMVKWVPPETSSLAKANLSSGHLIIPRVGTEDSGKWRCDLRRSTTTLTSAVITLKIGEHRKREESRKYALLFSLSVFLFCNSLQHKMRQLRHRLCKCKK